jgi:hypothetical protein
MTGTWLHPNTQVLAAEAVTDVRGTVGAQHRERVPEDFEASGVHRASRTGIDGWELEAPRWRRHQAPMSDDGR